MARETPRRDFDSICRDPFTAGARDRAGGADCTGRLRIAGRQIRDPRIEVRSTDIKGASATERVRAESRGQATAGAVLELRRERGEWRIDGLSGGAARRLP